MFRYKRFVVNPIEENCYIIWDDISREGAIIDCGTWSKGEKNSIATFIRDNNISLKYALQTHMHFDHCLGLGFLSQEYDITPMCHKDDLSVYNSAPEMVMKWFRIDISDSLPEVNATLTETTMLKLGEVAIQILHTPGHTPGGLCYYIPQARIVLTGDTLFNMSIGRTDLPGGNYEQELSSIREKLFTLSPDTKILPGHGPESFIGQEVDSNPYLQQ